MARTADAGRTRRSSKPRESSSRVGGLGRARVEDISSRAGVSKGDFYLHFNSKEDDFREILQRFLRALEDHSARRQQAEERFERKLGEEEDAARTLELECTLDAEAKPPDRRGPQSCRRAWTGTAPRRLSPAHSRAH